MNPSSIEADGTAERAEGSGAGITRRSIVRTAAWAVPALSVAVAMPLAAASTGQIVSLGSLDFEVADETGAIVIEIQGASVAAASATLATASPLSFDADSDGYLSPQSAAVSVTDGVAIFVVRATGAGATTLTVTAGSLQQNFTVTFS